MYIEKTLAKLVGKRVEITDKSFNEYASATYRGVIKELFADSEATFIMLDSGDLINTRYIANIKVLDED